MIRQLTPHDAAAYQTLRLRALRESPTAFSASHADEADRSPAEVAARLTPAPDGSRCVFGAFSGDRLAGFLAFIRPERAKLRHRAELAGTYVAPEFRRAGLGGMLLDAAVDHARSQAGVRQLHLGVNAANDAARSLYRSRGFVCVGVHPEALCVDGIYYDEELYVFHLTGPA
jgi:ribosomal protein S18 acetylase RimI-like enzyme